MSSGSASHPAHPPAGDAENFPVYLHVELWQNQTFWPISGWSAPRTGTPHFTCVLLPSTGSDVFPESLSSPAGWDWEGDWSVDVSPAFGGSDIEGWHYAPSFERLADLLRTRSASGVNTPTATVRKRRWQRKILCVDPSLSSEIHARIKYCQSVVSTIESSQREKDNILRSLQQFEERRSEAFGESLKLATSKTLGTLTQIQDIGLQLKGLVEFVKGRAALEVAFSHGLIELTSQFTAGTAVSADLSAAEAAELVEGVSSESSHKLFGNTTDVDSETFNSAAARRETFPDFGLNVPHIAPSGALPAANIFFAGVSDGAKIQDERIRAFAERLVGVEALEDAMRLITEIDAVLSDSRVVVRKNSDICRLSESAVRNFLVSLSVAAESSEQFAFNELRSMYDELSALQGHLPFSPLLFVNLRTRASLGSGSCSTECAKTDALTANEIPDVTMALPTQRSDSVNITSDWLSGGGALRLLMPKALGNNMTAVSPPTSPNVLPLTVSSVSAPVSLLLPREDVWLAVQRYRVSVREAREALCVLLAECLDLDLQRRILANRAHGLFQLTLNQLESVEETRSAISVGGAGCVWLETVRRLRNELVSVELPFGKLKSPFEELQLAYSKLQSGEQLEGEISSLQSAFISARGLFSFTSLAPSDLPPLPLVAGLIEVSVMRKAAFVEHGGSEDTVADDSLWKSAMLLCTVDGYVHVFHSGTLADIPDRSFYMKHCTINNCLSSTRIFELTLTPPKASRKMIVQESLVFRFSSEEKCATWYGIISDLSAAPLHSCPEVDIAATREQERLTAVLLGETARISLELNKYMSRSRQSYEGVSSTVSTSEESGTIEVTDAAAAAISAIAAAEVVAAETSAVFSPPQQPKPTGGGSRIASVAQLFESVSGASSPTNSTAGASRRASMSTWLKPTQDDKQAVNRRKSVVIGTVPIALDVSSPVQIIPKNQSTEGVPLATRHGQMIAQYEQGLQADKRRASLKVRATRGATLKDFNIIAADDDSEEQLAKEEQPATRDLPPLPTDDSASSTLPLDDDEGFSPTSERRSSFAARTATRGGKVREMSARFDDFNK